MYLGDGMSAGGASEVAVTAVNHILVGYVCEVW